MLVFPAQPGESYRLCFIEDGPFIGRAYSAEDVERFAGDHEVGTVNYMTGGKGFPGGPNIDEEIADLRDELRSSDERLADLDRGSPEYLDEAERNMDICQQILSRTCQLAGIERLDT